MTDRELMEMAAKAYWPKESEVSFRFDEREDAIVYIDASNQDHNGRDVDLVWNPRDDDGDSRRLQVKLRIKAYYTDNAPPEHGLPRKCAIAVTPAGQWFAKSGTPPDECADTRLAVLRAAAAIGKAMP